MGAQLLSCGRLFVTPMDVAHQASLSMEFSTQEYWSESPFPSPGLLLLINTNTKSRSVMSNSLWPVDCSPPGPSVHGILQARILELVAISFSRESSQPRDQTQVSRIAGRRFNLWATKEAFSLVQDNKYSLSFFFFWLCWIFLTASRLSPVAASRGYSSLRYSGFLLWWLLLRKLQ